MNKNIQIIILVITILCNMSSLAGEHIHKITIQGNKRVEHSTIENYLKLKIGDKYSLLKENESVKSLYMTSLFENINIKFLNDGHLIVDVTETSFIDKVVFRGNSKIKTSILSQELFTISGTSLSSAKVQLDVQKMKERYKRIGRSSTIITPKIESLENNRVQVIFDIAEGPKSGIKRIYFTGNDNYNDSELKSLIVTKESGLLSFLDTNDTYDPDRIEYDKELLKRFYQSVGFVDFHVISAIAELNPTKEYFTITYSIEEGEKYNLGNITIDNKLPNIDMVKVIKLINVKQGDKFNIVALKKIAKAITTYFSTKGYPSINVYPNIINKTPDNHTVDIEFTIDNADKIFINQININNNLKTEDKVIRREFKIAEGDLYNRSLIKQGERNLYNLDYFEPPILVNPTPTNKQQDRYDINIQVNEKSTASVGFDVGYNTVSGVSAAGMFGGISFQDRNLVGTGKVLNASVAIRKKSHNWNIAITEPYFLDKALSVSANIFYNKSGAGAESFLQQGKQEYKSTSLGFRPSLDYDIMEDLNHAIHYTIKNAKIHSPSVNTKSKFLIEQMGRFTTSAIGHTLSYDRLDNRIIPKNGYIISGSQEYSGIGGNVKYLKHEIDSKYFKSFINNKFTFKLSSNAGHIKGVGGKTIRISDRFNLGDYSLRGFSSGGVGPRERDGDEGLGGEKYWTISTELYYQAPFLKDFDVTTVLFMDMGSLWGISLNSKKYTRDDFHYDKSIRASIGIGFIWHTRITPIRVDWALPIKKKKYDDTQKFHMKLSTHL